MTSSRGCGRRWCRVALVVSLALTGVACGSYDDDDSPGGTTPDAPATTTAPVTEPGGYGY